MKGMIASALLGVLLASPVAAQIAGSGQRTEADEHLYTARKAPPPPVSSARAVPTLSGAPGRVYRSSSLLKVDVRAASRLGSRSGIRVISGGRVKLVQPGARMLPVAPKGSSHRSPMKLIRVGASPRAAYTPYGVDFAEPHEEAPARPPTIRINP